MKKGWEVKRLGEFSKISYGYTAKASFKQNGLKFLRITDIQENNVNWENVPSCQIEENDFKKYELNEGDIVFARTGATTGKSFLIKNPPKAVFASYLIKVHLLNQNISPDFLLLYFQTKRYWDKIAEGTIGSAQGGFNATKLADLFIPFPPLPEQHRIVTILDEAYAAIAKAKAHAEKNLANAREVFEAYLQSVFANRDNGWRHETLGKIAKVTGGYAFKSTDFGKTGEYQVIRMGNVRNGVIRQHESPVFIDSVDETMLQKALIKHNDVIITQTGTKNKRDYGFTVIIENRNYLLNQRIAAIRFSDNYLSKFFLYFSWTNLFRDQFFANETGTVGQGNVGIGAITGAMVPFPPINVQQSIVSTLDSMSIETQKLETIYQQKLAELDELKK